MERTITIKSTHIPEMIEVFGEGYQEEVPDGNGGTMPNPLTKQQFADKNFMQEWKDYIKKRVMHYRRKNTVIDETDIIQDEL